VERYRGDINHVFQDKYSEKIGHFLGLLTHKICVRCSFFPCGNFKIVAHSSKPRSLDCFHLRITGVIKGISETCLEIIHETPKPADSIYEYKKWR
jgi:hypothetical protein